MKRLLVGACCSVGGLVGIWTAIWSAPVDQEQGALGADLVKLAQPMLTHLALGIAAGAVLALTFLAASRRVQAILFGASGP